MVAGDLNDAYTRVRVLSTREAVHDRGVGPRQFPGSPTLSWWLSVYFAKFLRIIVHKWQTEPWKDIIYLGQTGKCMIFHDPCGFASDLKNSYARACA